MPPSAETRLWRRVKDWFVDDVTHAGADLSFEGLSSAEVSRLFGLLRKRASRIAPNASVWDAELERDVLLDSLDDPAALVERGAAAGFIVPLLDVRVGDEILPWLGVFLWENSLALYWWVGEDEGWNPTRVGALALLIDELRRAVPRARLALEWGGANEFFGAIDEYLAAIRAA